MKRSFSKMRTEGFLVLILLVSEIKTIPEFSIFIRDFVTIITALIFCNRFYLL